LVAAEDLLVEIVMAALEVLDHMVAVLELMMLR
jgi:hypothetical protein